MRAVVMLLLIGVLLVYSSDGLTPPKLPCCSVVLKRGIPIVNVMKVHKTSGSCPLDALIVTDRKGKRHCIDPECPWAQRNRETLKQKPR